MLKNESSASYNKIKNVLDKTSNIKSNVQIEKKILKRYEL